MNIPLHWPEEIRRCLDGYSSTGENYRTSSTADIYLFKCENGPGLFLKINPIEASPEAPGLLPETTAMEWLQGKLNVPRVLHYCLKGTTEYMLTEQIFGTGSHQDGFKTDIPKLIQLLARALKEIHRLPIDDCPIDGRVETQLTLAKKQFKNGILGTEHLPEKWQKKPLAFIDHLRQTQPVSEDLVFTHGDYCLPNILIQDHSVTGLIDWGYAGVGDPYRDFVSASYSIDRNLGKEWISPFFEAYGIGRPDPEKMAFHMSLHDLQP